MKKLMMIFFGFVILLSGCMNEFKFRADKNDSRNTRSPGNEITRNPDGSTDIENPKPDEPTIIDPDTGPVYPVVYKRGECTKDPIEVVPCLSCQITQRPLAMPLSKKATQLLKIMELGCAIANKSDPKNYRAPTGADILKYLNQANKNMYPDSTMTTRQEQNVTKWTDGDKKHLEHLFGGLWYNPPYSDDFETYFGLEPREARYLFCYGQPEVTFKPDAFTPLYSVEYYNCIHENGFLSQCRERANYMQANIYRKQLAASIERSLADPINDQELVPINKCHWKSMSGYYNLEMETKLIVWKNAGYEMAVYFESGQPRCESANSASIPLGTKVTVGAKHCENF